MQHNATPHLTSPTLHSGGSLKDGWNYILPTDRTVFQTVEVKSAFADEMSDHVREQTRALRALYLPSTTTPVSMTNDKTLTVEQEGINGQEDERSGKHFVVQRGHQVVAVATYTPTGVVTDVAVQPGATGAREALFGAIQEHAKKLKRSGSLIVHARTAADEDALEEAGFSQATKN